MQQLNYDILKSSGYDGYILKEAPEKVMQFGEGNFLRAFVDYFIDIANEKANFNGKVVLVQPIASGLSDIINKQTSYALGVIRHWQVLIVYSRLYAIISSVIFLGVLS